MYTVDERDRPIEVSALPQCSIGAPCPMLIAGEHSLRLAYYLEERPSDWDGTTVRLLSGRDADEPCAVIVFESAYAHMFGPPNDEAFSGHPLARRGIRPHAAFEVQHSSWVRMLERMNSVHPCHRSERFSRYKHFVFAFHDTTFECVAERFRLSVHRGSVWATISNAQNES